MSDSHNAPPALQADPLPTWADAAADVDPDQFAAALAAMGGSLTATAAPIASLELRVAASTAMQALARQHRVPGWGSHGTVLGVVERVAVNRLVADPDHPRDDWHVRDEDSEALRASLRAGQLEPLICTPLLSSFNNQPAGHYLYLIDGYRRLAGALENTDETVLCRVLTRDDGYPLSREEALLWWLTATVSRKPMTRYQLIRAFARVRQAWEELGAARPTQQELADRLGVTQALVSQGLRIAYGPPALLEGLQRGLLLDRHAQALLDAYPEPDECARQARALVAVNEQRKADGLGLLSTTAIQQQATAALRLVDAPATQIEPAAMDKRGRMVLTAGLHTPAALEAGPRGMAPLRPLLGALLTDSIAVLKAGLHSGQLEPSEALTQLLAQLQRRAVLEGLQALEQAEPEG